MDQLYSIIGFLSQPYVKLCLGVITSFAITFYGIPAVIKIARAKNLFDMPNGRTSHTVPTPRLGGAMIFAGVILSSVLFTSFFTAYELKYIIAGMITLFFIGLKDDILSLTPYKKLIGQIIAGSIVAVAGDIRFTYFNQFISNELFAYLLSIAISVFIVLVLINSINLIDGIDGLASGIGIVASIFFGIFFIKFDHFNYSIICFSLLGSLLAFSWFNVFSKNNKIFLGDTGSTIIGFLLAIFVIRFIEISHSDQYLGVVESSTAIAFAVLLFPLFDLMRITLLRIINHKPIFKADHNHLHHQVLKVFKTHLSSTMVILTFNIFIIFLTYFLKGLGTPILLLLLFTVSIAVTLYLKYYIKKENL